MKPFTTIKVLCITIFMFFVTTNLVMAQIHYDSSGNVGIGTTSPGYKLDVNGAVNATTYYGDGSNLTGISSGGEWSDGGAYIHANNAIDVVVTDTGNVGIGTTDVDRRLHIKASSDKNIRLEEDGEGTEYFDIGIDNSGDLNIWRDNGSIAMAIEDSSGDVGIGTTSPELELDVDGDVLADHYYYRSDVRLKKNITTIDNALDKVKALRGVKFEWCTEESTEESSKKGFTVEQKIGFIAQEVEEVLQETVFTDSKGYKAVAYGDIISVLVEAVKAQQVQIEELRARIEALEK